jgi:hypothetical protein
MAQRTLNSYFHLLVADIISTLDIFRNIQASEIFISIEKRKRFSYFGVKGFRLASIGRIEPDLPIQDNPEAVFILRIHLYDFWYCYPVPNATSRLTTIIHELFHIDSIGRGYRLLPSKVSLAHGNSNKVYNYFMEIFTEQYLLKTQRKEFHAFLDHETLQDLCGIIGDPILVCQRKMRHYPIGKISSKKMSDFKSGNFNANDIKPSLH